MEQTYQFIENTKGENYTCSFCKSSILYHDDLFGLLKEDIDKKSEDSLIKCYSCYNKLKDEEKEKYYVILTT